MQKPITNKQQHNSIRIILYLSCIVLFLLYARIHIGVLTENWPTTCRESAFITHTNTRLVPNSPAIYSWESLPEQTNLYGPLYTYAALPLAYLLPEHPYLAHRLTTGFFLFASCLLIGYLIACSSNKLYGVIGATFFYATTVASPSLAAGPDTLATFFYIAAIGLLNRHGFNRSTILWASLLGFAALLSKPYTVLVIPGMLAYCYLFISPKKALLSACTIALTCIVGQQIIQITMPAYFHTVFGIHAYYATRFFSQLVDQCWEFSYLHFSLLILFIFGFPYKKLLKTNKRSIPIFYGNRPFFKEPIGFDRGMTIIAAIALLISLGWHGGAYLIYFNHLLLPPLIIAALSQKSILNTCTKSSQALVCSNALLMLCLLPAQPKGGFIEPGLYQAIKNDSILLDPELEPLLKYLPYAKLVDNGQAEYLINYDLYNDSPNKARSTSWIESQSKTIIGEHYEYLFLTKLHDRQHLLSAKTPAEILENHYKLIGFIEIAPYYLAFRNREAFGEHSLPVRIYQRRGSHDPLKK